MRDRPPRPQRGFLPVPPADAGRPVRPRDHPEAPDLLRRRVVVDLTEREDRPAVQAVVRVGMGEDGVDTGADVLPVHLRCVVLRAPGTEEHGVRERRVEVHVGKAGQGDGEPLADQTAQLVDVRLRLEVLTLVLALRVDQQAIRSILGGRGPDPGLGSRIVPVDELPRAYPQSACVQGGYQRTAELRPGGRAVAALDHQRPDAVVLRLGDDRRQVAVISAGQQPDPHPPSTERVPPAWTHARQRAAGAGSSRRRDRGDRQAESQHRHDHCKPFQARPAIPRSPATVRHTVIRHTAFHRTQEPSRCLQVAVRPAESQRPARLAQRFAQELIGPSTFSSSRPSRVSP